MKCTIAVRIVLALGLGLTLTALCLSLNPGSALSKVPAAELHVCPVGCPYSSVQAAVDAASEGDLIKVATGVYTDVSVRPRNDVTTTGVVTQVVYISRTVTIQGGYTTTNWTTPYPITQPTTLDAQGQGRVIYVIRTASLTIEGLRITGGNAAGFGGTWNGYDAGGGMYTRYATATIDKNQICSNTAQSGGGIYALASTVTLNSNQMFSNTADYGGGLFSDFDSNTALYNNIISSNTASQGGGLNLYYSSSKVCYNTITSNFGSGLQIHGDDFGGLGTLVCHNLITANTADEGGGLFISSSNPILDGNTIRGNSAWAFYGGGITFRYSNAILNNNIIADNYAEVAGSGLMVWWGSSPHLFHNTIARNYGGDGSGVYVTPGWTNEDFSTIVLTNTILVSNTIGIMVTSGNTATLNGVLWFGNGANTSGAGLITVTREITSDPAFVAPDAGNYHIRLSSAAIDQGVDADVSDDMDGDPRPQGNSYDLGADETGLVLSKQANANPVQAGTLLTYTLRITNTSNVDLHATITDFSPAHVTPSGLLTWTPTITTPGGIWSQQVIVAVEQGYTGTLTNNVQVTTIEGAVGADSITVHARGYRIYLPLVLRQSP